MAISDETLAIAIPAELKSDHPDPSLVVQAIAVALAACENSSAMTTKSRMRDVHNALKSTYVPIYQAHLAKEDEDWGALNDRVKMAESPPVNVIVGEPEDIGEAHQWKGQASDGTFWLVERVKGGGETTAKIFSEDRNSRLATANGDTAVMAIANAYKVTGKRAEVIVSEPTPAAGPASETVSTPAVESVPGPAPESADDDSEDESPAGDAYDYHRRPNDSGVCGVCGAPGIVRAEHRKVDAGYMAGYPVGYVKLVRYAYPNGQVYSTEPEFLEANGRTPGYNRKRGKTEFASKMEW